MIFLDAKRYQIDGFEELYFEKVYAAICRMQGGKKEGAWKKEGSDRHCIPRELVRSLQAAGILEIFAGKTEKNAESDLKNCTESELKEILRNLILADAAKLRKACELLGPCKGNADVFLKYFYENAYAAMCRSNVPDLWDAETTVTLPVRMVEQLGLRTCPYCNRDYIGVSKGKNLGVQLDHFFSKSKYPYFAVSLYNLIPSCGVCNNIKRAEDSKELQSPFLKTPGDDGFSFHLEWDGRSEHLLVEYDKEHERHAEIFHLQTAYDFHRAEARHFREKMTAYPQSMLDEITRMLADESTSVVELARIRQELEMSLFGEYFTDPDQYDQKPLSKLYRDLYYGFRGWK